MTTEKKIVDREQEIVFTNYTNEDFEGKWNKKIYRLKAEKSYYLPFYLAEHFGKHLVDRELNKMAAKEVANIRAVDPRIDSKEVERKERSILGNINLRQELMDKCVIVTDPVKVDFITPKEVPVREVPLKTQQRSAEMVEKGQLAPGDLGAYNQPKKAKEEENEFEELDR